MEPGRQAHRLSAVRRGQLDLLRAIPARRHRRRDGQIHAAGADRPLLLRAALEPATAVGPRADRAEPRHAPVARRPRQRQGHRADAAARASMRTSRSAPKGRLAVLGGDDLHPYELSAVESGKPAALTDHNAFLAERSSPPLEPITSRARTAPRSTGLLMKPIGYQEGQRYPTLVRMHGGPVYQFSHEFNDDWQFYAAQRLCRRRRQPARQLGPRLRFCQGDLRGLGPRRTCRTCSPPSIMW